MKFKVGDRVICNDDELENEIGTVVQIDKDMSYHVQLRDGKKAWMFTHEVSSLNEEQVENKGAKKNDSDYKEKPPMELLSGRVLEEVAMVLGFGAQKYSSWNWQQGFDYSRLLSASLRHIMQFKRGEDTDSESEINHLSHAICSLMFLRHQMMIGRGNDDRGEE